MNNCDHAKYVSSRKSGMSTYVADIYISMLATGMYGRVSGKPYVNIMNCGCSRIRYYTVSGYGATTGRLLINNERFVKP